MAGLLLNFVLVVTVIRKTSTRPPTTPTHTTEKAAPRVKDTKQATSLPKEIKVSKSQRKSIGVYHDVDLMVFTTITVLGLAMSTSNIV